MKRQLTIAIIITGLLLIVHSAAYAAAPLALEGNDYNIMARCTDNAGDYCSKNTLKQDEFLFYADGDFGIGSFDGGIIGLGDSGSFNVQGISFSASYEVVTNNSLDKYTFNINGLNIGNIIIIGQMNVSYYELKLTGYNKSAQAKAYFFGRRN